MSFQLYCVHPNCGRVESGESIDVSGKSSKIVCVQQESDSLVVILQPEVLKEEHPLSTKCEDRFLIQTTIITPDKETLPPADIVCIHFAIIVI